MPSPRTKPSRTSLIAFFLIVTPLVYTLSYAPAFRFTNDEPPYFNFEIPVYTFPRKAGWQELYRPVEWLTDNTPLREPLLSWAGLWEEYVEADFRLRSDRRMQGVEPYPDPPPSDGSGVGTITGGFGRGYL